MSYSLIHVSGELCFHGSLYIFDRIIIKVAGNKDMRKNLEGGIFRAQ